MKLTFKNLSALFFKPSSLLANGWNELAMECRGSLNFIKNYCHYFFSSHRKNHLDTTHVIKPSLDRFDTRRIDLCMRDTFILSRSYEGDLSLFLKTIHNLRKVMNVVQSRPSQSLECKDLVFALHQVQKELVYLSTKYEEVGQYFIQNPNLSVLAQSIKAECHHIFDYCNSLIKKISQLELSLLKKR